ncbi:hypothetical protein IAR50_002274 [Cryptococcus sp. DSM 104548]
MSSLAFALPLANPSVKELPLLSSRGNWALFLLGVKTLAQTLDLEVLLTDGVPSPSTNLTHSAADCRDLGRLDSMLASGIFSRISPIISTRYESSLSSATTSRTKSLLEALKKDFGHRGPLDLFQVMMRFVTTTAP